MTRSARANTRDIARAAVRAELSQVAFDLFRRDGFDRVTVNEVAAAAVDCLSIALDAWTDRDGGLDLQVLVDQAFTVLTPR